MLVLGQNQFNLQAFLCKVNFDLDQFNTSLVPVVTGISDEVMESDQWYFE